MVGIFATFTQLLISYEFNYQKGHEIGGDMLINWYESGGVKNKTETYEDYS